MFARFINLTVGGASVALALAGCAPEGDAIATARQAIVGGADDVGDPAVVLVELAGGPCTGALIAPRVAVTAAHCLGATTGIVRFGAQAPWDDSIAIVGQHVHPGYRGPGAGPDLGLVRLARPALVGPLARRSAAPDGLVALRVAGFGRDVAGAAASAGVKRTGTIAIAAITADDVVGASTGPVFTCAGDSGGPGFDGDGAVVAVVSSGDPGCAGATQLTRLDRERGYLDQVVAAWDGPCAADGGCAAGCATLDPDCDPCGVDGACAAGCAQADLDCPLPPGPQGALGAACDDGADCQSGLCDRSAQACTEPCGPGHTCPSGYACGADGAGEVCRRDDGGCRAAGDRGGLALVLVVLAWLRRYRRAPGLVTAAASAG